MTLGLICVYLVLDVDLTDGPNTNYFVFPTYESEEMYAGLDRGEIDPETGVFAYVAMASRKDPDNPHLCPSGQTNLQIMTLAPRGLDWWGVEVSPADGGRYRRNQGYLERKQAITEALLDAGDRVLDGQLGAGSLRDHIVFMETATPVTHERYTRSTGGTSYGYVHSPEQSGMHRPAYRTEIEGLWIVGANTVSGHGVAGAMVGGVNCAGEILGRPLLVEMVLGTALGDPADVPADPADFDPVEWCRGARLRAKRAAGRAARGTGIGESVGSIT